MYRLHGRDRAARGWCSRGSRSAFFAVDRNLQRRNSPAAFAELRRNLGQQRVKLAVAVEVERAFRRVLQQFGICSRDALELRGDRDRLVHIADGHVERPGGIVRDQTRLEVEFHALIAQGPFKFGDPVRSVPVPPRPSRTRRRAEILKFRLRIALAQTCLKHVGEHPGVVEHIPKRQLRAGRRVEIIGFVFPVRLVRSVVSLFLEQQAEAVLIPRA